MLVVFGECFGNYREAARLYRNRYPNRRHPNNTVIRRLKIRAEQGQLTRRHGKRDYNFDVRVLAVLAAVHIDPHISTRQIARQTGIPQRTIVRIFRKVLFCQWARQMIAHDADFFKYVLFSDESTIQNVTGHSFLELLRDHLPTLLEEVDLETR
ncbi:hypothetical protein X777_16512 [Ooceraea biroi]|uniref:DUF4817 domain-containing protein n=1 Tax=Ooceraea biroi TaxID=2015173 RepID=A0A026WUS4_OOCBI|nr:hypothetical protein X777_16512 [Ooceraea biroi]